MRRCKWLAVAALATGLLFQFGSCGTWGVLATILGLSALNVI